MKLKSLTLYEPDAAQRVRDVAGEVQPLQMKRRLSEPTEATFDLVTPDLAESYRRRQTLQLVYESGPEGAIVIEWLRIQSVRLRRGSGAAPQVVARSMWDDLAGITARQRLQSGQTRLSITIAGVTAPEALSRIVSADLGCPDFFQPGVVDSEYQDQEVWIYDEAASTMDLLAGLSRQTGGEWTATWDPSLRGGAGAYRIDLLRRIGDANTEVGGAERVISELPGDLPNRLSANEDRSASGYFSRLVGVAGAEGQSVTIAGARWPVANASREGGQTVLTLEGDPLWQDGALTGRYAELPSGERLRVAASASPAEVTVEGDAVGAAFVRFVKDAAGTDLIALTDDAAEAAYGRAERRERFSGVQALRNLAAGAGLSADLSDFESGVPVGFETVGAASVSETSAPLDVTYGTRAAEVAAPGREDGIQTQAIPYSQEEDGRVLSLWVSMRVTAGAARVELVDSAGQVHPPESKTGDDASGGGALLAGFAVDGITPVDGPVRIRVLADEDESVFTIDALTLVASGAHAPFAPEMGPRALWHATKRLLLEKGGARPPRIDGEVVDLSVLDPGGQYGRAAFGLGDQVRVALEGQLPYETRIVELTERVSVGSEASEVRVRLSEERADVTRRPLPTPTRPPERGPQAITLPTVTPSAVQRAASSGDGDQILYALAVDDPSGVVRSVDVRYAVGRNLTDETEWITLGEGGGTYETVVPLGAGTTQFEWRVVLREGLAPLRGRDIFDGDTEPGASYAVSYEHSEAAGGTAARVGAHGDEDTARHVVTISQGEWTEEAALEKRSGSLLVNTEHTLRPGQFATITATPYGPDGEAGTTFEATARVQATAKDAERERSADAVTRLSDDVAGVVRSLPVTSLSADLRKGQDLLILRWSGEPVSAQVAEDTPEGAESIPVAEQYVRASEGDTVRVEGRQAQAERLVTSQMIQERISRREKGTAVAELASPASGFVSSLSLAYLRQPVRSGDDLVIYDRVEGRAFKVKAGADLEPSEGTLQFPLAGTASVDAVAGSALRLPDDTAFAVLRLLAGLFEVQVGNGDEFAALSLSADERGSAIRLVADLIRLVGTVEAGDDMRSASYVPGEAGWLLRGDGFAEFLNVLIRGIIEADEGRIGGLKILAGKIFGEADSGALVEILAEAAAMRFRSADEDLEFFVGDYDFRDARSSDLTADLASVETSASAQTDHTNGVYQDSDSDTDEGSLDVSGHRGRQVRVEASCSASGSTTNILTVRVASADGTASHEYQARSTNGASSTLEVDFKIPDYADTLTVRARSSAEAVARRVDQPDRPDDPNDEPTEEGPGGTDPVRNPDNPTYFDTSATATISNVMVRAKSVENFVGPKGAQWKAGPETRSYISRGVIGANRVGVEGWVDDESGGRSKVHWFDKVDANGDRTTHQIAADGTVTKIRTLHADGSLTTHV